MELVLLQDVQSGYGSGWVRIANTEGVHQIQINDRFREQGFGQGAEELEVAGIDISPVGGLSKLYVNRGAGATQPEIHRLGAVFYPISVAQTSQPEVAAVDAEPVAPVVVTTPSTGTTATSDFVPLPKRGRPLGSKNKPRELTSAASKAFGLE